MFHVVHDRIAIGVMLALELFKYVPPHVIISIGFGTFTSPTCVWPSLGWYTEWARLTFMVSRVDELHLDDSTPAVYRNLSLCRLVRFPSHENLSCTGDMKLGHMR